MSRKFIRTTLVVLAGATSLALAPAAAQADTLVYVQNGYVYVAAADGSSARAVSPQSPWWAWPSESDSGTIAVAGGAERVNPGGATESSGSSDIYAFDQHGNSLLSSPVVTPGSVSSPTLPVYVQHFRISPDGSTVAYNVVGCCGASGSSTFVSPLQSGSANWSDFQDDYVDPVWVNGSIDSFIGNDPNALGLSHNGIPAFGNVDYAIYHASNRNAGNGSGWVDTAIPDGYGYQVSYSRDIKHIALFLEDSGNNGGTAQHVQIHLETVDWSNQGNTTDDCTITLPASEFSQPHDIGNVSVSYTSDDSTLVWGQDDGIYEANVSSPANCAQVNGSIHRIVAGGAMPSFGLAPLSAPTPPTPPTPTAPAKPPIPPLPKPTPGVSHLFAAFSIAPKAPRAGRKATFNATASRDTAARIVRYVWSFGDHSRSATGKLVKHAFKRRGRYMVTLTITDTLHHTKSIRKRVVVVR